MMPDAQLIAAQTTAHYFRLARLTALDEWWHWLALVTASVSILAYVIWMYRRDAAELPRGLTIVLALLRVAAFVGILIFFLQIEKRADRQVVKNSRALVVVDTSQSMGLSDLTENASVAPSRLEQVIAEFSRGKLLSDLRSKHDVVVYRFDQTAKPTEIATFGKLPSENESRNPEAGSTARYFADVRETRLLTAIAGGILAIAILSALLHLLWRRRTPVGQQESWPLLVATVTLIIAVVVLGVANLRHPDIAWPIALGLRAPSADDATQPASSADDEAQIVVAPQIDWTSELLPRGVETRLGDALRYLVGKERGGPIAGIILITDGNQNAGVDCNLAVADALDAAIPVYA
ncbi:MAG TPA: hypothetical protein VL096_21625, partial [Pirellulaceae bacterium]|nr:hypothetical protein [Pirellulaceae bacterium]